MENDSIKRPETEVGRDLAQTNADQLPAPPTPKLLPRRRQRTQSSAALWLVRVNSHLALARTLLIAVGIIIGITTFLIILASEAFTKRQSILNFSVPESISKTGLTGEVLAKGLHDQLLRRRESVRKIELGKMTGSWLEKSTDIEIIKGSISLQQIFRYLRQLAGNETTIDGEVREFANDKETMLVVRVSGKPQKSIRTTVENVDAALGLLADYVLEVTQPVVLVAYKGTYVKSELELAELSKLIQRIPRDQHSVTGNEMAILYYSYGSALKRAGRSEEALAAWTRSRAFDDSLVDPYWAAGLELMLLKPVEANALFDAARKLESTTEAQLRFLSRKFAIAWNAGHCYDMGLSVSEARSFGIKHRVDWKAAEATVGVECEYSQDEGVSTRREIALLHPEAANYWNALGIAQLNRTDKRFRTHARDAFKKAVSVDPDRTNPSVRLNLASAHATLGELDQANANFRDGVSLRSNPGTDQYLRFVRAKILLAESDAANAELLLRLNVGSAGSTTAYDYLLLADALRTQRKHEELLNAMKDGLGAFPDNCALHHRFGAVLLELGQTASAIESWKAAIRRFPKCDLNYLSLAKTLLNLGSSDEAKSTLDLLRKASPKSDGARIAAENGLALWLDW